MAYDVLGEGGPVVLVHGTPFSSYVWRGIARELARTRQVFVFDLLGYGQSEKRDGQDVSLGVQNELLASPLRGFSRKPPVPLPGGRDPTPYPPTPEKTGTSAAATGINPRGFG